jgi:hypothetical protein
MTICAEARARGRPATVPAPKAAPKSFLAEIVRSCSNYCRADFLVIDDFAVLAMDPGGNGTTIAGGDNVLAGLDEILVNADRSVRLPALLERRAKREQATRRVQDGRLDAPTQTPS